MDFSEGEVAVGMSHTGGLGSFVQLESSGGVSHVGAGTLWRYVEVLSAYDACKGGARKWRCSFCKETKTGGVNRVRAHLFGERNHGVSICTRVPVNVREKFLSILPQPSSRNSRLSRPASKKRETCASSIFDYPMHFTPHGGSSSVTHTNKTAQDSVCSQPTLKQLNLQTAGNSRKKLAVDSSIARFLNSCNIPFHVVRSPYFEDMIREAAAFGPSYKIPSCEALKTLFLEEQKSNFDNTLQIVRERWVSYGCSIVSDDLSDSYGRMNQNILVYSRGNRFYINSVDYSICNMDAIEMFSIWRDAIEYVGSQNVLQIIVGPALMKESVFQLLVDEFPHIYVSPCTTHCLHQLLEDIYHLGWIKAITEKGKDVVLFMASHHKSRALFLKHTEMDLLKPFDTGIESIFTMLEKLAAVKIKLRQTIVSDEWITWETSQCEERKRVESMVLCSVFWDELEELLLIIKPILRVTRLIGEDEPCIGKLYDSLCKLLQHIEQLPILASRIACVRRICMEKWEMLCSPLHVAAYILDPEFQGNKQEQDKNVLNGWERVLDQLVSCDDEKRIIKNQLACYRQKEGFFGWPSAQADRFKVSATTWWEDYGAETKELQRLAVRILSQGCSSFSGRRLRKSFDVPETRKPTGFMNKKVNDTVFVNANLRLLSKFRNDTRQEKYIGGDYHPSSHVHMLDDPNESDNDNHSPSSKS